MSKKDKETREKKIIQHRKKKRCVFLAGWFVLIAFVLLAFFIPQAIFRMQDNLLQGKTTLGVRENIDVEALSTTYERSLPLRMIHFAECLEAGDHLYVTSQELSVTQEVYDYLYSESGFWQDVIYYFADLGIISPEMIWNENTVSQWKQYVIYSDDYAKGVNFILWYIELQGIDGEILKVLADAETGTIYALKEENSGWLHQWTMGNYDSQGGLTCNWYRGVVLWYLFATYYETVTEEQLDEIIKNYESQSREEWQSYLEGLDEMGADELTDVYLIFYYYGYVAMPESVGMSDTWQEKPADYQVEKNVFYFRLHYSESSFDVAMDMRDADIEFDEYHHIIYSPNVTIGIRQIYEMIPEFQ